MSAKSATGPSYGLAGDQPHSGFVRVSGEACYRRVYGEFRRFRRQYLPSIAPRRPSDSWTRDAISEDQPFPPALTVARAQATPVPSDPSARQGTSSDVLDCIVSNHFTRIRADRAGTACSASPRPLNLFKKSSRIRSGSVASRAGVPLGYQRQTSTFRKSKREVRKARIPTAELTHNPNRLDIRRTRAQA